MYVQQEAAITFTFKFKIKARPGGHSHAKLSSTQMENPPLELGLLVEITAAIPRPQTRRTDISGVRRKAGTAISAGLLQ